MFELIHIELVLNGFNIIRNYFYLIQHRMIPNHVENWFRFHSEWFGSSSCLVACQLPLPGACPHLSFAHTICGRPTHCTSHTARWQRFKRDTHTGVSDCSNIFLLLCTTSHKPNHINMTSTKGKLLSRFPTVPVTHLQSAVGTQTFLLVSLRGLVEKFMGSLILPLLT